MTTIRQSLSDEEHGRLVEQPDGFYWRDKFTDQLYGPFATRLEAVMDMQNPDASVMTEGESLAEAEAEIGIADWIDPETGEPAEGMVPHLGDN